MQLSEFLRPRGGKGRRFITWLAYGIIAGTFAGVLLGIIWVTVELIIDYRSGIHYATNWVIMGYVRGAILFGLGGAVVGAILGFVMGIAAAKEVYH